MTLHLAPPVLKALLAGVARAPLGADSVAAPLQDVLTGADYPLRLWHLVAAHDLVQRAGFAPAPAGASALPCPDGPTCPRSAERVLQMIMQGVHANQLHNWLALARRHGMALPHGMLTPLLELGTQQPALRAALAPVLGQRGHWLAAQHPDWATQYSGGADPAGHWELGTLAERSAALTAMRREDPAAALAALVAAWPQEPLENRLALLPTLAIGLNLDDEAFLESALDDKRKEVRTMAQKLLTALPGAQLVERCKARLAGVLAYAAPALAVTLPDTCDKAMKRDGIGLETHRGLGEKAGWLVDLLRCVPPARWSASWLLTPRQVLDRCAAQEFGTALVTGLAQACTRTLTIVSDTEAIEWFAVLSTTTLPAGVTVDMQAMQRLPPAAQESIVQRWLDDALLRPGRDGAALEWAEQRFGTTADCLPLALSQRLLASAQRAFGPGQQPGHDARRALAILGRTLAPATFPAARVNWPAPDWDGWPEWRAPVDQLIDTLQFRTTMHASFLENDE